MLLLFAVRCRYSQEIDPHTFNLDLSAARAAITPKTRAIMLVHYGGVGCDMDGFVALCKEHNIVLLEDAAQAIGATWDGKPLGSFGAMSGFSFHHTKNVTCGEGGALLVNDPALVGTSEIIRDKGTDRSDFLKRTVTKYQWQKLGSSYQLSELASAVLSEQLLRTDEINGLRMKIWQAYDAALSPLNSLQTPHIPAKAGHNAHIYSVLFKSKDKRDRCAAFMRSVGIVAAPHYVPLHSTPGGLKYGRAHGDLSVTDRVADTQLRLPLYATMSKSEQEMVITTLLEFLEIILETAND